MNPLPVKRASLAAMSAVFLTVFLMATPSARSAASPGERVYKSKCSICHASDGSGNTPKGKKEKVHDLRSSEVQKQSDTQLIETVTNGKKKMKPYKDKLTPEQIQQVIAYIREMGKGE